MKQITTINFIEKLNANEMSYLKGDCRTVNKQTTKRKLNHLKSLTLFTSMVDRTKWAKMVRSNRHKA